MSLTGSPVFLVPARLGCRCRLSQWVARSGGIARAISLPALATRFPNRGRTCLE